MLCEEFRIQSFHYSLFALLFLSIEPILTSRTIRSPRNIYIISHIFSLYFHLLLVCVLSFRAFRLGHASNFKPPQLPPLVKQAFERSAEATVERNHMDEPHYHHQHYYIEKPSPAAAAASVAKATAGIIQRRKDYAYKPRVGEILVKDSVLYNSDAPVNSQQQHEQHTMAATRRNYWPLVDNTVSVAFINVIFYICLFLCLHSIQRTMW